MRATEDVHRSLPQLPGGEESTRALCDIFAVRTEAQVERVHHTVFPMDILHALLCERCAWRGGHIPSVEHPLVRLLILLICAVRSPYFQVIYVSMIPQAFAYVAHSTRTAC